MFAVDFGGEGEEPAALNQQPLWASDPAWKSIRGETLSTLTGFGHTFLLCPNDRVSLPDDCADLALTNNTPVDVVTFRGLGVQSSEIRRILKSGGVWVDNGIVRYQKP